MQTYRLGSSPVIYTPGFIAWAINGYAFERDRAKLVRVVCSEWGIPADAAHALLSKRAAFTVDGETVVFSA